MIQEIVVAKGRTYIETAGTTVESPVGLRGVDFTTVREILKAPKTTTHCIYVLGIVAVNPTSAAITVYLQKDTAGTPATISPTYSIPAYASIEITFPHAIRTTAGKNVGGKSSSNNTAVEIWLFAYADAPA